MPEALLSIRGLKTYFHSPQGMIRAVDGIDLDVYRGEILGIVGESGSGKTMTAFSLMGLVPAPPGIIAGEIQFGGENLLDQLPQFCRVEDGTDGVVVRKDTRGWDRHYAKRMAKIRGRKISIIFQEPVTSLDPLYSVGNQIAESILRSGVVKSRAAARVEGQKWLQRVAIHSREIYDAFPHQLSGGMCQRIMLSIALACRPDILIADEPTTALDASIQLQILNLLARLKSELGTTIILITHDMHVISHYADRVAIFYAGRVVEVGQKRQIMDPANKGKHPYTEGLLRSIPILQGRQEARELTPISGETPSSLALPSGCKFAPRCPEVYERCEEEPPLVEVAPGELEPLLETDRAVSLLKVENLSKSFPRGGLRALLGRARKPFPAVQNVSFELEKGETLGLVGESGCGKTSLARSILLLMRPNEGRILFYEKDLLQLPEAEVRHFRRRMRLIFQNPDAALNPHQRIQDILDESLAYQTDLTRTERRSEMIRLLEQVNLPRYYLQNYPYQLSGGQKRRVTIARVLAGDPTFIIGDEPVSALDVSIQAQILNLLRKLQDERAISYLFISHDIGVVKDMSRRIAVMYRGRLVEIALRDQMNQQPPQHPYSELLFSSVLLDEGADRLGNEAIESLEMNQAAADKQGCPYLPRCHRAKSLGRPRECSEVLPLLSEVEPGHYISCHFAFER